MLVSPLIQIDAENEYFSQWYISDTGWKSISDKIIKSLYVLKTWSWDSLASHVYSEWGTGPPSKMRMPRTSPCMIGNGFLISTLCWYDCLNDTSPVECTNKYFRSWNGCIGLHTWKETCLSLCIHTFHWTSCPIVCDRIAGLGMTYMFNHISTFPGKIIFPSNIVAPTKIKVNTSKSYRGIMSDNIPLLLLNKKVANYIIYVWLDTRLSLSMCI